MEYFLTKPLDRIADDWDSLQTKNMYELVWPRLDYLNVKGN